LIGHNVVLTAAHNIFLWDYPAWVASIKVTFGISS